MNVERFSVKPDSLLVSGDKAFFSLQGEGQSLGKPAVFLRLHMCNLACGKNGGWKCDTPYTWNKEDPRYYSEPERWSLDQTAETVKQHSCKRLVVTGGEPLLHGRALDNFLDKLPDWKVEVETNGTMLPTFKMVERGVQFNVSPKLSNSGNLEAVRYRPQVLQALNKLPNTTFKFVVMNEQDVAEVDGIVKDCGLDVEKIILMPEGVTPEALSQHGQAVAEVCKQRGYRLVPRLQIMLWGQKRRT